MQKIVFAINFIKKSLQLLINDFNHLLEHLSVVELYLLVCDFIRTISLRQVTIKPGNLVIKHEKYRHSPDRGSPRQR